MPKIVSVIIPAYNEAEYIYQTLQNLKFDWIKEIIVIDDGSQDGTAQKVTGLDIFLYRFSQNKGKGEAVTFALKRAKGEIVLLLDADLGESVKEADKLVKPILNKKSEITIGILPISGGGLGIVRKTAGFVLNFLTGEKMKAPLSGQRAFRKKVIDNLLPLSSGFGLEIGMDIELIINNYNYKEVYCNFNHNVTGQSLKGYLHRFKQLCHIIKTSVVKGYQLKLLKKGFINDKIDNG